MSGHGSSRLSRHLLRQALDAMPVPALIVDGQGPDRLILLANAAAAALCGQSITELVGRSLNGMLVDIPEPGTADPWLLQLEGAAPLAMSAAPLYGSPGVPVCWLVTPIAEAPPASSRAPARPAAESAAASRPTASRPAESAATGTFSVTDTWLRLRDERNDPATGVLSRAAFLDMLERDVATARRSDQVISVMQFRVEGMESYQALFGRHATDACLRKVAHSISTNLRRGSDCCGRTAHDRFTVLSHGGDPQAVAEFAARIAGRVRDLAIHHPRAGNGRFVTVSFGLIVTGGPDCRSGEDVLARVEADLENRVVAQTLNPVHTA